MIWHGLRDGSTKKLAFAKSVEKDKKSFFAANKTAQFTKGVNEYYPIPQTQIDLENAAGKIVLKQNPGYN